MSEHPAPDWRDRILTAFTPGVARLTLVSDPDGLLLEPALLETVRARGFEIVDFDDPVAFRFDYESRFRPLWDSAAAGPEPVVRTARRGLEALPHDLLQTGRRFSFGLEELFPDLSYPVIAALERSDLDALYRAQQRRPPGRLGDGATADFVLRHVFDLAPELVRGPSDLLRLLLRRHYRGQRLPRLLDERLAKQLRRGGAFGFWSLEAILPDREAFFAFLQERWPVFLDRLAGVSAGVGLRDARERFVPKIGGPADLPFDHEDVRVYIDNLFVEGMLRPVAHESGDALRGEWAAVGVRIAPEADRRRRLRALAETVDATVPGVDARHGDWLAFAWRWAELNVLALAAPAAARADAEKEIAELRDRADRAFLAWLERRYAGLHNQPPVPPVMVHHLPRRIARCLADDPERKAALLVVDGLALDQWIALREVLAAQRPELRFREGAAFAWIPTITSVSRQAIFAGAPPLHFPASVLTTGREEALWTRFWADRGLAGHDTACAKGLGDGALGDVRALVERPGLRVLGLVVDKVDKIMHGMALGAAGMHNQVRQWAGDGFMAALLDMLLDSGFTVFLTSDHGNLEAVGKGRPAEGATADLRGERVRLYSDPALRSRVKARFPDAIEWPATGLPEDCLALLAPGRSAFVRDGERVVGHGGASLEEVVVPMVEIGRAGP